MVSAGARGFFGIAKDRLKGLSSNLDTNLLIVFFGCASLLISAMALYVAFLAKLAAEDADSSASNLHYALTSIESKVEAIAETQPRDY